MPIPELAESIAAQGLLQNLVVTKSKKRGVYEVVAGGRRLQAIQLLLQDSRWSADQTVQVKLVEANDALMSALSRKLIALSFPVEISLPFCTSTVRLSPATVLPSPTLIVQGLGAATSQVVSPPTVVQAACAGTLANAAAKAATQGKSKSALCRIVEGLSVEGLLVREGLSSVLRIVHNVIKSFAQQVG